MLKKSLFGFILFILIFVFVGCSQAGYEVDDEASNNQENVVEFAEATTPERKIIYNVDISFDVDNLEESSTFINNHLEDDEWFDKETVTSTSCSYVIRVRTDRLDDFISTLKDEFTLRSYEKVGTDISLEYQDAANEILALQAQLDRLLDLYDEASLSEMILINEQISDIEIQLQVLNGTLSQYDSLADYSVVTIDLYSSSVRTDSPFINRLGNAVVNGLNGLLAFFDGLLIILATIFPFLLVFGSAGFISYTVYKKRKTRQRDKEKKDTKE